MNMDGKETNSIKKWIKELQKRGKLFFSRENISEQFPDSSEEAIHFSLTRLVSKGEIVSVLKGFYAIIPPEYAVLSMVPPTMYIDALMKYLKRPYYLALLNAAEFYGAAHQKPMEHFVITVLPPMRSTLKHDVKVNFSVTRKTIPQNWLKPFKTQTGYIQVSAPELTAADLITFQKEIGGLNRACTVLYELMETVRFGKLDKAFFDYVPTSTIQRLGHLLENELEQEKQANILFSKTKTRNCKFQKIPLKYNKPTENCEYNQKWKIIVNEQIEIDDL
jgi:predicted transcriptional regulator of viral defense system